MQNVSKLAAIDPGTRAQLMLYARAGFLSPLLTKTLLGEESPAFQKLKGAGLGKDEQDREYDGNAGKGSPADRALVANLGILKMAEGPATQTPQGAMEQNYNTARQMVLDPARFRASRPDLFRNATPQELTAQNNLAGEVGHVYRTADYLRQQGKLEFVWVPTKDMGNAMMDTSLHSARGPDGKADWKIVVRVREGYKDADPMLTTSVLTHELQHAYDMYQDVKQYGAPTAQLLWDSQEWEMRAFSAGGKVDVAYFSAIQTAGRAQPADGDVSQLVESSRVMQEYGAAADKDPKLYQAMLAKLAQNTLRERGYIKAGESIHTLDTAIEGYRQTIARLEAERVAAQSGSAGLDAEIARARAKGDVDWMATLTVQKNRPARPLSEIDDDRDRIAKVLDALKHEQERGLSLTADTGLKVGRVP